MGTVYPSTYMRGGREVFGLYPNEPNFPRFTSWLGNNSSYGKQRRLLGELHTRMLSSGHLECDRRGPRAGARVGFCAQPRGAGAGAHAVL